jgi:alpha-beta hydrolase superfamily lysophospholipase
VTKRSIAITCGVTLCGAVGVLYGLGWALSRPVPAQMGPPPPSLNAEAVTFPSQSGSLIHGWLSRSPAAPGSVLLLPGVRANRLSMVRRAEFLRRAGYSTLLIDFQGTGESAGEAITFGWRERFDVIAATQYLRAQIPGQPVAVIAVSLGGAATLLACPPLALHGVVLEAVYPSIDRAVVNRLRMRMGPFGPVVAPLLLVQLRSRLGISANDLKPVEHIGGIGCPVLLIGGTLDQHTTVADTGMLFEAAREPKELWLIPDAAHVDFLEFAGDAYRRRILSFLATAFGQPTG